MLVASVTFICNMAYYYFYRPSTLSVPQSPVLIAAPTDHTSDSITVGWSTDVSNELPVMHVVSIVAQDGNEVQRVHVNANLGEASVSGLLADTDYLVTVWAENSIGRSNNQSLLVHTRRAGMLVCACLCEGICAREFEVAVWNECIGYLLLYVRCEVQLLVL